MYLEIDFGLRRLMIQIISPNSELIRGPSIYNIYNNLLNNKLKYQIELEVN